MKQERIYAYKRIAKDVLSHAALSGVIAATLSCCHPVSNRTQSENPVIHPVVLLDSVQENYADLYAAAAAFSFYKSRGFAPVWLKSKTNTPLADSMVHIIRSARFLGLLPQDYHIDQIEILLDTAKSFNENIRVRRLDMLLTDAFLSMAMHLKKGRIDINTMERMIHEDDGSQISSLQAAIGGNGIEKMLTRFEPTLIQYQQLKSSLKMLLDSADSVERPLLLAGKTIDSLEISSKVASIEVTLERLRKENKFSGRYMFVNIPSFTLTIMEEDVPVFESKVIVGTTRNQTPILDAFIGAFTLYPHWQVPRKIAVNEILPHIKEDSTYLSTHQYEVIDIHGNLLHPDSLDWRSFNNNNFPIIIRQRQGSHNSLGIVKYSFHNPYGVYLHDTNAPKLFNNRKRSLSHGCIRLEKAKELSYFLLEKDSGNVYPEDLDQYYLLQRRLEVRLQNPIPLYIRYLTSEYHNGELHFYNDIYSLDKQIREALYARKPEVAMSLLQ